MKTTAEQNELARLQKHMGTLTRRLKVANDQCTPFLKKSCDSELSAEETAARDMVMSEATAIRAEVETAAKAVAAVRSGAWAREEAGFARDQRAAGEAAKLRMEAPTLRAEVATLDSKLATLKRIEAAGGKPLDGEQLSDRNGYTQRRADAVARLAKIEARIAAIRKKVTK